MLLKLQIGIFLITSFFATTFASVGGYVSSSDKKRLLAVLAKSFGKNDDFSASYYGAKGYQLLKEPFPADFVKESCAQLKQSYKDDVESEIAFQAVSAWKIMGCAGNLHGEATVKKSREILESGKSSTTDLRFATETLKVINHPIPNPSKIAQLAQQKLREDDSLQSIGQALHLSALLGSSGKFALDRIEEVIVQADEIDGKLLQWEGGLTTTSLLITGLLKYENNGKNLNQEQADKLANYLLSRRTVQTFKGAWALLDAVSALTQSSLSPVAISVAGMTQVTSEQPDLKIHISDLLGDKLKTVPSPIMAQSATRLTDDVVVLSKQPLQPTQSALEYFLPLNLDAGRYKIVLGVGSHISNLVVRVLGSINVDWLEIGLSDSDGTAAPKLARLQKNAQLSQVLQADSSQHLIVKFTLNRKVHQAFVRLFSGKKEIIFIAEPESSGNNYKLDVDLATELSYSGTYQIEVILGDSVAVNPVRWQIGSIDIKLNAAEAKSVRAVRGPKPEIKHLFRPAEKRPSEAVSLFFTAVTVAPLLLLLILWLTIGINFKNFTPLSVPFHLGFGGILGLFTMFWLKLDMFTTCAWLIPIGGFTFLAGQKLLSNFAKQKK